jgi:hypothetical protein
VELIALIPSDPKNVETAHKQILAIAPILPGQKTSHQFDIPPRSSKQAASSGGDNLIDFGDDDATLSQYLKVPASTSHDLLGDSHSTGNNISELMAPLQPTSVPKDRHPVQRIDSTSDDLDVFVDAEEK